MTSTSDKPKLLLVDFENVPQVEISKLDDSYRVIIFVGASQKSVPIELVTNAQRLGSRVEWQKVAGDGRNALDFFIACHLGRVMERAPRPECTILSRDKGFDPLLTHLTASGLKCRRINSLQELKTATAVPEDLNVKRVVEILGKLEKRSRPRKRRTLAQAISAAFQKKLSRQDIDRIIDTLLTSGLISDAHGNITYEF
jgi:hypothetical protein